MQQKHNTFGSFIKVLIGVGLAVLIFMSYMLAEQQGWVNTNIAGRILRGVEDGKAIRESRKAEAQNTPAKNSDAKIFGEPAAPSTVTLTAPAKNEAQEEKPEPAADKDDADDFGSDDAGSDDSGDSAGSDESSDESADKADSKPAPAAKPAKSKKIDYAEVARKKNTWPKAVQMRVKGTMVSIRDKNGNEVTKIEVPVGTRLFVRKVTDRGVLEVKNAVNGQIFQVHASRTTFSRLYTGKTISDGLVASGDAPTKSKSSSSSSSSSSDDDFGSDDSDSGSGSDDFSDDDFFDDDF
ncbi:MAG: hypothetical protein IKW49_06750 [Opitutales bacterium]|nr:hypothetical protein [Opitutales bacterium]